MTKTKLSTAEAELYDRQIRLWGIESQEKLRAANVLLINVRGLGSEVAKDILLSGINSLTILDNGVVTEEDFTKNFLLEREYLGKKLVDAILPKAQALNPLVKIVPDSEDVSKKDDDFFTKFTMIVATGLNTKQILSISSVCRKNKVKFICGDIFGMFGFSLADFDQHMFYEDQVKIVSGKKRSHDGKASGFEKTTVKVQGKISYPELDKVLVLPQEQTTIKRRNPLYYLVLTLLEFRNKYGRDPSYKSKQEDIAKLKEIRSHICNLFQIDPVKLKDEIFPLIFGELVTIASIVGGIITQEVIKAVSHKEVPVNNMFLLDPFTYNGREETILNNY